MTLPLEFFPGLSTLELMLFNVIQSLFSYFFFVFLMYLAFWLMKKSRTEIDLKKILSIGLIIEIFNIITSLLWILFILFVLVGVVVQFLFYFMVPATIVYLAYYSKPEFKESKVLFLYIVAFLPSLILSTLLTSVFLNLVGIHNYFVFMF